MSKSSKTNIPKKKVENEQKQATMPAQGTLPPTISYTKPPKDAYRAGGYRSGNTMIQTHQGFEVNMKSQYQGKVGAPVKIMGGPSFGAKAPLKFGQPPSKIGSKAPAYEVIVEPASRLPNSQELCPQWDGLQPMNAHNGKLSPIDMRAELGKILSSGVNKNQIDFHQVAPFTYDGHYYTKSGDCEFRCSIFQSKDHPSVIEIRRMSGEPFCFSEQEKGLLDSLGVAGAIEKESFDDMGGLGFGTGFGGFGLPPLPMDLDSSSDFGSEMGLPDLKDSNMTINGKEAEEYIHAATDEQSFRDEWRFSVSALRDAMENEDNLKAFKQVPNVVERLMKPMSGKFFDTWIIKSLIEIITELMAIGVQRPAKLAKIIGEIKNRWSQPVVNNVGSAEFRFPASQQIERACASLLNALQQ